MDERLPWFKRFIIYHVAANPHHGFPKFNKSDTTMAGQLQKDAFVAFFENWNRTFVARRVTEAEANAASAAMAVRGSTFPDEHLALLLHHIANARRIAADEALLVSRRKLGQFCLRQWEEREKLREVYAQLPEEEQAAIRAEVLKDYASPPPEKFLLVLCIDRLGEIRSEGEAH